MAEAGSSALDSLRGFRTAAATLLALFVLTALAAAPAQGAVDRKAAAKKALAALGSEKSSDPVIVFGLRTPLRPRSVIGQSGPAGGVVSASDARSTGFHRTRSRRIRNAGAQLRRADVVLRTGAERAWFFFEDAGPHQAFEHPGRVVLVGADTGKVRVSEALQWVPLVNGRAPVFFQSARNYESDRYRVFDRPWPTDGTANRAGKRQAGPAEPRQRVADALAAEKSCALRISDTLGDFFDFGGVDRTRARLGLLFEGLEKLNAGFVSRRYTTKSSQSPIAAAQELIDDAGCRDLFLYVAGAGTRTGEAGIVIGLRPVRGGLIEWHTLSADDLEALVKANPAVTFKFLFDSPYSSRVNEQLTDEANTVLVLSSGGPNEASFTFLPELGAEGVNGRPRNPDQLLEFTNAILAGLEAFVSNPAEIDQWIAERGAGGASMMTWMMARALSLSPAWMFAAPLDTLKLPVSALPAPPAPPVPPVPPVLGGAPPNRAPVGTTPAQPTLEDTAKAFTLTANDPDGDALTFTITDQPDHGDLTGTLPNLVYTPDQDFDGTDSFGYQVSDGRGGTDTKTVQLPVTPDNDAAAVTTTTGGSAAFTEDGAGVPIDGGLTIADPDSTQLEGATVAIGGGQVGDVLVFTDQAGITGDYDAVTGVLTLSTPSGTASVADFQAALRSVEFDSTNQDPTTSRTIDFRAEDGDEAGAPAARGVTITPVNDAPMVTTANDAETFSEDGAAVNVDDGITLSDVDSATLSGATVQVTTNRASGDELLFTDTTNIDGTYTPGTGTLTLSGTDTLANYQAALRSITFRTLEQNPSTSTRTVSFQVDDGAATDNLSAADTEDVAVAVTNDAPVLNATSGSTTYAEQTEAVVIDSGLTVADVDDTQLDSATVSIGSGQTGDVLDFAAQDGISGTYDAGTRVLTLTTPGGTASVSDFQTALRSVKFSNHTNDDPSTSRTISFAASDGDATSSAATRAIAFTPVNDKPVVAAGDSTAVSYTEDGAAPAVFPNATITDPDDTHLTGADVSIVSGYVEFQDTLVLPPQASGITANFIDETGDLILSGTGSNTVAEYQAAIRSVTYANTSNNPSTGTRRLAFRALDDEASSEFSSARDVTVTPTNDLPVVATSTGTASYTEGSPVVAVDPGVTVSDPDDANLEAASVALTTNFDDNADLLALGDNAGGLITPSYDPASGVLTLTGAATKAQYQTALRSVTFETTGDNPTTATRTVRFRVDDSPDPGGVSADATRTVTVVPVNDEPELSAIGGTLAFDEGDGATAIDEDLTIADPDSTSLSGATVALTGNFASGQDVLALPTQASGITGSYNAGTGVLTLSGTKTLAEYRDALRAVTYDNTSNNPSTLTRTATFQVTDADGTANGGDDTSAGHTRDISIGAVNDAPVVGTGTTPATFTEGGSAVVVDPGVTASDVDSTHLTQATVEITGNYSQGDDLLTFADTANITSSWDEPSGKLTLSGSDTVANYQAALRTVKFSNPSQNPSGSQRTIRFQVNDGSATSNLSNQPVIFSNVSPVNDAPVLTTTVADVGHTEDGGATIVDGGLDLTDVDSSTITDATVFIDGAAAGDLLEFTDTAKIDGTLDPSTRVLTLDGTATLAEYQAALRSVTYRTTDDTPPATRTVKFQVSDGGSTDNLSNVASRVVNITAANDAPVVDTSDGDASYTEAGSAAVIDGALTLDDGDSTHLTGATVEITGGELASDALAFVNTANITHTYSNGVLTLSGSDTVANYQAALRSVRFSNSTGAPGASREISFQVDDGAGANNLSNVATKDIAITEINSPPVIATNDDSAATYTEDGAALPLVPAFTVTDVDSTNLIEAFISLTNGAESSDVLEFTAPAGSGITATFNSQYSLLTLSGTATLEQYRDAIRSVTFRTTSDNPSTATRRASILVKDDGAHGNGSNSVSGNVLRHFDVARANDAPVVDTSDGDASYTEAGSAAVIDGGLNVTDPDSANLTGATVEITGGELASDTLSFVNTANITHTYSNGLLTLTGSDTVANYQAALRTVRFSSSSGAPGASREISFRVDDGAGANNLSSIATRDIAITTVNTAPVLTTSGGTASFTEDGSPVAVDPNLTVSDVDSANLTGATVTIADAQAGDTLVFTDPDGRIESSLSGNVLTLTGNTTLANYQAALRTVQFDSTQQNPTSPRTINFRVDDGGSTDNLSNIAGRNVAITPLNDKPVVTTSGGSTAFTEGGDASVVDSGVAVTDIDSLTLASATVAITNGFKTGEDVLAFTNTAQITGAYVDDGTTGVLTLTAVGGSQSLSTFQAALRTVTFDSTSTAPGSARQISFRANDGSVLENLSDAAVKAIAIAETNSAPVVTPTNGTTPFTEGPSRVAVDDGIVVTDADSANLISAEVAITSGLQAGDTLALPATPGLTGTYDAGTLVIQGTATVAAYQAALRTVTFGSTSDAPVGSKTVRFQVDDGQSVDNVSNTPTKEIAVTPSNDPATVATSAGNVSFVEDNDAVVVDNGVTVADADDTELTAATVAITAGHQPTKDTLAFADTAAIDGDYDDATGVLTLTAIDGSESLLTFRDALRAVEFGSTSHAPGSSRTIAFRANDGDGLGTAATRNIIVTQINDAPTVSTTGTTTAFTENGGAVNVDTGLVLEDVDSTHLTGATVDIAGPDYAGDVLSFVNTANITHTYSNGVLTLTGSDTVANYQTALRSVKFNNTSDAPDTTERGVVFQVDDGGSVNNLSNAGSHAVSVTAVNDAPAVTTSAGSASFTEGGAAAVVDNGITVTDADSTQLDGATVSITANFSAGDDGLLATTGTTGIGSSYDNATGVLTLTGTSSVANYQAVLRTVRFGADGEDPSGATRTVSFQVDDVASPNNLSNVATRQVTVTPVNDAPNVFTTETTWTYTENDAATVVDGSLGVGDVDSTSFNRATVQITGGYESGSDRLSVGTLPSGITASAFDTATGLITLTGTATMLNYRSAMRAVRFHSTSEDPSTATRTFSFTLRDVDGTANGGDDTSDPATRDASVRRINDDPVAVADSKGDALGNTRFIVGTTAGASGPRLTVSGDVISNDTDVDSPQAGLTATAASSKSAQIASCAACPSNVTMEPDGQFTYDPPQGFTGNDTFTYVVEDNDTGDFDASENTATGTITVTVVGPLVWYVDGDSSAPAAGSGGRSHTPFSTLADLRSGGSADAKDGNGDFIFVYDAVSSYTGGIDLEANQRLHGEPHSLDVDPNGSTPLQNDIVLPGGGNPVITNASGNGIGLADGVDVRRVNVTGASGAGINGASVPTATVGPNTTISNTTGPAVQLTGAAGGLVVIGSTISTSGPSVNVQNRNTSAVDFQGPITGGAINVQDNTGAIVDFNAALTISSGTSDAFNATGGGTVIHDGPTTSTLTSSTGRALDVANTTIGTGGLDFRSVSANGADVGINLVNTGTTAGVTISGNDPGNSVAPGTGGTIQSTTGNAITLSNTQGFSADEMAITSPARDGVSGNEVTHFTFTDGSIANAGQSDADITDSAFAFNTTSSANENNVDGNVTITGNTVTNPYGSAVHIFNHSGTINDLNVSDNTLTSGTIKGNNPGGGDNDSVEHALQVVAYGGNGFAATVTKGTVANNNITGFPDGDGIAFLGGSQGNTTGFMGTKGSDTNKIVISGNRVRGHSAANPLGTNAIVADVEGRGGGHFEITNNGTVAEPLSNVLGSAILVGNAGDADAEFHVNNNRADLDSSIAGSSGIGIGTDKDEIVGGITLDDPDIDVEVANNHVTDSAGSAIRVLHRDSFGTMNLKMTGNTARSRPSDPPSDPPGYINGTAGIAINNGSSGVDAYDPTMCATISGNTAEGAVDGFGDKHSGIELFKRIGAADSNGTYTFGIQGLSPSPTANNADNPVVDNYVSSLNPASVAGNSSDGSGFFNKKAKVRSGNYFESCTVPGF